MDAKSAIRLAKSYIADVFSDEGIYNIGLEEVTFEPIEKIWSVTIGFSRDWDKGQLTILGSRPATRTYKIVEIQEPNGAVIALKNRLVELSSNNQ